MIFFQHKNEDFFLSHIRDEFPNPDDFKMHIHSQAELLYVLSGGGSFHIEGNVYATERESIFITRPTESHYLELDPSMPYERIVINFNTNIFQSLDPEQHLIQPFMDRPVGQRNLYKPSDFNGTLYQKYLFEMVQASDVPRLNVLVNLIPLLAEIRNSFHSPLEYDKNPDTIEYRILNYINNHLSEDLSLSNICKKYYISTSQLYRLFKKATGTTVLEYVTHKRLMLAKGMLIEGEKASDVFSKCGFHDYSTFYRAYKKHFGASPKAVGASSHTEQE